MKRVLLAVCSVVFAFAVSLGDAQAARIGGGKSVGMQRQAVAPKRVETPQQAPAQQAAPAPAPTPAAAPAAAPKRNWLGPVAGLAAGLGLAALASHLGFGEGLANFLTIALLAVAAVVALRWLLRRKVSAAPPRETMQYAGAGEARDVPAANPAFATSLPSSGHAEAASEAAKVPAGFDSESFVRVAKANFVRLQAANDARDLDDIREFVSPEMYAEIKLAIDERGNAPQQTDVVTLDAELLEVVTEGNRHVASVYFSGMLREAAGAPATPFAEVWNLVKPVSGERGWVVAGIQQAG
jgi:predicted lipid-binding transport protein (Tim44 family)